MTITAKFYLEEAKRRGWKYEWIDEYRNILMLFPPDEEPILIRNNVTELATAIGSLLSSYKVASSELAKKVGFKVPESLIIEEVVSYEKALPMLQQNERVVVKPMDSAFGNGVSTNVTNDQELKAAVDLAREKNIRSEGVIVQPFCTGKDYRLYMLDGKLVGAIERVPLVLVGDGEHTIKELLNLKFEQINQKQDVKIHEVKLNEEEYLSHLSDFPPETILEAGQELVAHGVANLSRGGEAIDVTDSVHPEIIKTADKLSKLMHLDMCAVDVLSADISQSPDTTDAWFIEVNVAPGFRGHYFPTVGKKREIAPLVLDAILKKRHENIS